MSQSRRAFLEKYIGLWSARADARRRSGATTDLAIAGALTSIVADMRGELAEMLDDSEAATVAPVAPAVADPDRITWRSPCFYVTGRFNPWAGTHAQAMLASADACDRLGHPEIGDGYRARAAAAEADPEISQVTDRPSPTPSRRPAQPRFGTWTGPPIEIGDPAPFAAGEQVGFGF